MGRRVARRVLPISVLVLALVAVPVLMLSPTGLPRLENLRGEQRKVDEQISKLAFEIRQLRLEVEEVKAKPETVERIARDELGLVRRTELVFQFSAE